MITWGNRSQNTWQRNKQSVEKLFVVMILVHDSNYTMLTLWTTLFYKLDFVGDINFLSFCWPPVHAQFICNWQYVCYIMYVRIDWGKYVRTGGHMYPSLLEACRAESEASVNVYHVSTYTPDHPSPLEMWLICEFHLSVKFKHTWVACLPVQIQTVNLATIWYVHCCTTILVSTNDSPNRATHPGLKLVQQITLTCKTYHYIHKCT